MKIKTRTFVIVALSLLGFNSVYSYYANHGSINNGSWVDQEERIISSHVSNIDPQALRTGLTAYANAKRMGVDNKPLLTIIDYSKPSTEKRLWVINLDTNQTLFNTWVAHGKNSGMGTEATSFSNSPESKKTSIGVYLTADTYYGHDGYSLRLRGLDQGFNSNAYSRAIVMHGAHYVNAGRMGEGVVGHSWGCPAVNPALAKPIIDTIKQNTIIVAYYPDHNWLSHSQYLG